MIITSVLSFITQIQKIEREEHYTYFYRGHSDRDYELIPSIYRNKGLINNESVLYRELITHNPDEFSSCKYTIDYLVKMQHFGLPTRLLDITLNPLVALYFAAASKDKKIGEVIFFKIPNIRVKYFDSDTVSVLANIAKQPNTFAYIDVENIELFNNQKDIQYLAYDVGQEKPNFTASIRCKDVRSVICVKPKMNNPRIMNQSGAFLLFGVKGGNKDIANINNRWIIYGAENRIFIKNKDEILKELDMMGINASYAFPQLDKYAELLIKKYELDESNKNNNEIEIPF
jgi:hypothetical protein